MAANSSFRAGIQMKTTAAFTGSLTNQLKPRKLFKLIVDIYPGFW